MFTRAELETCLLAKLWQGCSPRSRAGWEQAVHWIYELDHCQADVGSNLNNVAAVVVRLRRRCSGGLAVAAPVPLNQPSIWR